jgi:hypothetical protein
MRPDPQEGSLEFFDCDVLAGNTLREQHPGFSPAELRAELDRCGVDRALVYTHNFGPCAWIAQNRTTLAVTASAPGLHPCFILPQSSPTLGVGPLPEVEALIETGACCFRLDAEVGPASGPLTLEHFPQAGAIWRCLEHHRVPLLIPGAHLPEPNRRFGYTLEAIVALCSRHPALPVVLLSPPYGLERPLAHALATAANLHLSLARLAVFGQVEALVRTFGAERLLFGSGLPFNDPAIPCGVVRYSRLADSEKRLIASGNLERLLSRHD